MVADQHGNFGVRQVNVHMHGTDREILKHPAVLLHAGPITRMVPDGPGRAAGNDRRARGVDPQPFSSSRRRSADPQAQQLLPQPHGIRAWRRLHLDLILGELTADQIAQGLARDPDNTGPGRLRRPGLQVNKKVLLLNPHQWHGQCLIRRSARRQAR